MSQRRIALARLHEELRNIQILDRVHDLAPDVDAASERAHVIRQNRRKQIADEVVRIKASAAEAARPAWVGSVVVFVFALGYAMFHFLVK